MRKCTKLDIAGAVVEYIAARVDFPDIDIRQRLTVSKGYGVSEILIRKGSNFDGQTISRDQVAGAWISTCSTLYRGTTVIPNRDNDRTLQADDRLLCFGKAGCHARSAATKSSAQKAARG